MKTANGGLRQYRAAMTELADATREARPPTSTGRS
jgi:hypothetical protein